MTEGVHAELLVDPDGTCPVAALSDESCGPARLLGRAEAGGTTSEDVFVPASAFGDTGATAEGRAPDTHVFEYEGGEVHRVSREASVDCPCERVDALGIPVTDVHARDGMLSLTVRVADRATLAAVADALSASFTVELGRIVSADEGTLEGASGAERALSVDRTVLTGRQREVVRAAYDLGYFERTPRANLTEVAAHLSLSPSTVREHLRAAQGRLLGAAFSEAPRSASG